MLALTLAAAACDSEASWSGEIAVADFEQFEREVYPLLLRDCAHNQCHGAPERHFQVLGPGRTRLKGPWSGSEQFARERSFSYQRALSMLVTDGSRPLFESPLLQKPLERSAGGASHSGVDVYGRNVYRSQADPTYAALLRWAQSGMPIAGANSGAAGFANAGSP